MLMWSSLSLCIFNNLPAPYQFLPTFIRCTSIETTNFDILTLDILYLTRISGYAICIGMVKENETWVKLCQQNLLFVRLWLKFVNREGTQKSTLSKIRNITLSADQKIFLWYSVTSHFFLWTENNQLFPIRFNIQSASDHYRFICMCLNILWE